MKRGRPRKKNFIKSLIDESDRKEPLHDSVCRFLAENLDIFNLRGDRGRTFEEIIRSADPYYDESNREHVDQIDTTVQTEHPVVTDTSYVVGFIDVAYKLFRKKKLLLSAFIEVKIRRQSVSEILRQINMYRVHLNRDGTHESPPDGRYRWFVVTKFATDNAFRRTLEREEITAFDLDELWDSDKFAEWLADEERYSHIDMEKRKLKKAWEKRQRLLKVFVTDDVKNEVRESAHQDARPVNDEWDS